MNLVVNGNFAQWPLGTSFDVASGSTSTPISGALAYVATGANQPEVGLTRQRFAAGATIAEGAPEYYLRVDPATAPTAGDLTSACLKYVIVGDLTLVNRGATLSFWANTTIDREIVVQVSREFIDGVGPAGVSAMTVHTQSFQLRAGWRKYQVFVRFPAFAGATHGLSDTTTLKIFLQGNTATLGESQIEWSPATLSFSQLAFTPYGILPFENEGLPDDDAQGVESSGSPISVLTFGADPLGVVDSTIAIQRAIDAAITAKTSVYVPTGIYLLSSWGSAAHILTCGYSAFSGSGGVTSATNQTTPRQDSPSFGSLLIEGVDTGKRLNRIDTNPHETYTKGAVFKLTGDCAGKIAMVTSYHQSNIRIKNLTFIGTGFSVNSIGFRHNVSSTKLEMDNVGFWHFGTAIDIGGDYADPGLSDQHSDFNYLHRVSVDQCGIGVNVGPLNAYITTLDDCYINSRINVRNVKAMAGATPSPRINIRGGFYAPLTECGAYYVVGTVDSVAGQNITVTFTNKTRKIRSENFQTVLLETVAATTADFTTEMYAIIDSNCEPTGSARVDERGVFNRITAVSAVDSNTVTLTLEGLVKTDLAGKPGYFVLPASVLLGDHFNVDGAHFETTADEDKGFGGCVAILHGYKSTTTLKSILVNMFNDESAINRRLPKVYHRNVYPTLHGFPLEIRASTINATIFLMEVDPASGVFTEKNCFYTDPLVLNHNGTPADGYVTGGDSPFFKFGMLTTPPGNEALALTHQQGGDTLVQNASGLRRRRIKIVDAAPTRGTTGESYVLDSSEPVIYRIGGISAPGYYDSSAIVGVVATIDAAVDPTLATVTSLNGLDIGRVIDIAGAGVAGGTHRARIAYLRYFGGVRQIWLTQPAVTSVSGATGVVSAPTVPVVRNQKIGDPNSSDPQLIVEGSAGGGDILELRRSNGITQVFAAIVSGSILRWRDKTLGRNILDFSSGSAAICLKLFGGMLFPTLLADPILSELGTGFAMYRKNNKFVITYGNAGVQTFIKLALDGSSTTWVHDTVAP